MAMVGFARAGRSERRGDGDGLFPPAAAGPERRRSRLRRWRSLALAWSLMAAPGLADNPPRFPEPVRAVAPIVSDRWSDEETRDRGREADQVMDLLRIGPGMAVADIGAGSGYHTVRLSRRVGREGAVLAEDVVPETVERLRGRLEREGLTNVRVTLGHPDDAGLPPRSVDRILMVAVYHEVEQPYALLWRLAPALKPGGLLGIVDADRSTTEHGTPLALLRCEVAQAGYTPVAVHRIRGRKAYLAVFRPTEPRPEPSTMRPCPFPARR